jgi:SH3-like domain-containing protein
MRLLHALAVSALVAAGCKPTPPASQQAAPAAQPAATAPAGATAEAPPTPKGPVAYVTAVSVLKKEPIDAAKIAGKPGSKDVANFVDLLYRGEKVAVLETREEWARVRSSGEKEGWMKRTSIFEGEGLVEATILAPTEVFDRPDLLAANAKKKLDPGTFVLVVKEKKPFSEVNHAGSQDVWVLSERLNTSEKEVMVARLAEKIRYLWRNNKKDDALANLAIAKQVAEGSVLVGVLEQELGLAPADAPAAAAGAAVQPAAAPAGSDPLQPGAAANQ